MTLGSCSFCVRLLGSNIAGSSSSFSSAGALLDEQAALHSLKVELQAVAAGTGSHASEAVTRCWAGLGWAGLG
jgi:hypothetical protein